MGTKRKYSCDEGDSKEMKHEDLLHFSNIFASEFNNNALHDRILVFQVDEEGPRDGDFSKPESSVDEATSYEAGEEKEPADGINEVNGDKTHSEFKQTTGTTVNNNEAGAKSSNTRDPCISQVSLVVENKDSEQRKMEKEQFEQDVHVGEEEQTKKTKEDEVKGDEGGKEGRNGCNGDNSVSGEPSSQLNQCKIFVHSFFLAVQSSYFRALFCSGMKESYSKEVTMRVSESELQAHLTLIEAMYRLDVLNDKDYHHVLKVLVLADKYDVNRVLKKCKYTLMSTLLTLEKCVHILDVVNDLPEFTDLIGLVEKFLVKEFTPFDKTWTMDKFLDLSEASLRLLLSSNELAVQSENTVFVALCQWIRFSKTKQINLSQSSLLSLVRFEFLTVDFLFDVVQHTKVVKKMPSFNKLLQKGLGYHAFSQARRDQLKVKPVQRTPYKDPGPTFSWIINKNALKKLSDSSSISSDGFWFQGYPMELELEYATDSRTYVIYLAILDMREGSSLNISLLAKSDLFEDSFHVLRQMYTMENYEWGLDVQSKIAPSEVPEAVSHVVDVWVDFI